MKEKTTLTPEARKAKNLYAQEWRKAHPENVRETNARYWNKRVEKEVQRRLAEREAGQTDE